MRATSVTILAVSSSDTDEPVGPAEIPEKRAYIFRDVQRCARLAGLRRAGPPSHPFNPLKALRLCAAVAEREARFQLTGALLDAAWSEGRNPESESTLRAVLQAQSLDVKRIGAPRADGRSL